MTEDFNIRSWNRKAWDRNVARGNRWTVPVSAEVVNQARRGDWQIQLTCRRPVPREWFPSLADQPVLCLGGAGGQQGPVLAAAGAVVTVLDNSPAQLQQDRLVADRDGLEIQCIEGDMADLTVMADESFELIVHPCSNCFVPDVNAVWRECFRVLRPGGTLLAGMVNPVCWLFSEEAWSAGDLTVTQSLPWSDAEHRDHPDVQRRLANEEPLEFGHLLQDLIGGQLRAGFHLKGLFEDGENDSETPLSQFTPWMLATCATRPGPA
jgi:SAM-dependent methyltransferase